MTDAVDATAQTPAEPPAYLTLQEVATRIGASTYTLRKLIRKGALAAVVQDQNSGAIVALTDPRPQPYQYLIAEADLERARELAQAQAGPKRPAQPPVPTRLNTSEQVPERAAAAEAQEQLTALRVENAALRAERDILREDVDYLRGVVVGFLPPARMQQPPEQHASDPPKRRWWRLWRMRGER